MQWRHAQFANQRLRRSSPVFLTARRSFVRRTAILTWRIRYSPNPPLWPRVRTDGRQPKKELPTGPPQEGASALLHTTFRSAATIKCAGNRPIFISTHSRYHESSTRSAMMATGTVKWFNPIKGYGFIQPAGGGKDVFVHITALDRAGLSTLNEGQQVEYEIIFDRGKESAGNLKVK